MFSLGGQLGLGTSKMESFVRMMHLKRYEELTDDDSRMDQTDLLKVEEIISSILQNDHFREQMGKMA